MFADWLFWGLGGALALAGLWLQYWSLFADRARGRRRCPKCWYDMSGTEGMQCPECGYESANDRRFFRTRRRWRTVLLSLVVFVAAWLAWQQPKIRRDGWASIVPNTLIILALRLPDNDWAFAALEKKTSAPYSELYPDSPYVGGIVWDSNSLHGWQWNVLADTCIVRSQHELPPADQMTYLEWMLRASEHVSGPRAERLFAARMSFLNSGDPQVRARAILYVTDTRFPTETVQAISPFLDDSDANIRASAISSLRLLGAHSPVPEDLLVRLLKSTDVDTRARAASALGTMGRSGQASENALMALKLAFNDDTNSGVRARALSSICLFDAHRDEARRFIQEAIRDPEPELRSEAIWQMSAFNPIKDGHMIESVLDGLKDESPSVREAAVYALQVIEPMSLSEQHVKVLKSLLTSDDDAIRQSVAQRLRTLPRTDEP